MNNWISVKDKMPDFDKDILIYGREIIVTAQLVKGSNRDFWSLSSGVLANDGELTMNDCEITHWMPLPEPPKP